MNPSPRNLELFCRIPTVSGQPARRAVVLALGLVLTGWPAAATGWKPNVPEGADIVMKDHRWPVWDAGTYYCFWYMSFVPPHPRLGSFYGGINTRGPDQPPGMFMSYWGEVHGVYEGPFFYRHGYGAEGASGGAHGDALFLRPGAWYRLVMRIFPPNDSAAQESYVGWWVKDLEKNEWHTHSVVRLPARATGFRGNSGFVEALAPAGVPRAFERRLGYCRVNGQWKKANVVSTSGPKYFKVINRGTVLRYDRAEPDAPAEPTKEFAVQQPDQPPLDPPAIARAVAFAYHNQVLVQWAIPKSASPQLGYQVEVFATANAAGSPLQAIAENAPYTLARRLDLPRAPRSVRLTVRDIFDQETSRVVPVTKPRLLPAAQAAALQPGLHYAYYEAPDRTEWERLPDFHTLKPVRQGRVETLDDTVQGQRENLFALRFAGYLRAPADGLYVFSVGTCDGSRLRLDGRVIADDDGVHGASVNQYRAALQRGRHAFELLYFKGSGRHHGTHANLADKLSVQWSGPGFGRRKFTAEDFWCPAAEAPSFRLALNSAAAGGLLEDNLVEMRARINARGHRIDKVELYSGRMLLTTVKDVAVKDTGELPLQFLFPPGKTRVRARLWYDGRYSVDADKALEFETRPYTEGPWQFIVLGPKYPVGARCQDGVASFMGEGFCVGYQKVSGNFTLTAHIADLALATEENGVHPANWLGLYTSNVGQPRKGQGLESTFNQWGFGLYLTAGQGLRGSADYPDLAGTRMSLESFPAGHRWLRIVRRGSRYQGFTSADGRTWQKALERISRNYTTAQYAGICFRAVPGKGRSLFHGALDQLTLEHGAGPPETRARVRPPDLTLDGRITALVQSPGDANILYARSPTQGVRQSTDRGETWQAVNGRLNAAEVMAVRSVAVHPTDGQIVLRGTGSVIEGTRKSGLWRSTNGGRTWQLVTRAIDFDGRGPGTWFGEVIAFCPNAPNLVAAAGETGGLFLSRDTGRSWAYAGLRGERITCLAFHPQAGKRPALVVGTFADAEFRNLGLREPATRLNAPGRIYWIRFQAGKPIFDRRCELNDFGVANLGFGAHENFATFATSRGVFYTWQRGHTFAQRRQHLPADQFFVALGYRQFKKQFGPKDWRSKSTTWAAPFSSDAPHPIYLCPERTTAKWRPAAERVRIEGPAQAVRLNAGITCLLPDRAEANTLYLCNRYGVFKSTDLGRSYKLVCGSRISKD